MNIYVSGTLAYDRIMDFPGRFADHILPEKIHVLNVCFMVDSLVVFGGASQHPVVGTRQKHNLF